MAKMKGRQLLQYIINISEVLPKKKREAPAPIEGPASDSVDYIRSEAETQ